MNLQTLFDASSDHLVEQAITSTVNSISHAWVEGRESHVVLTGGRTGLKIAKALDLAIEREITNKNLDPKKLHIWFSDERFVELDDPDRNDSTLISAFNSDKKYIEFHRVKAPKAIGGEDSHLNAGAASDDYSLQLATILGHKRFDSVLLSMGEDGHIASCFPGQSEVLAAKTPAAAVFDSPKPPSIRVTITLAQLAKSMQIFIFVLGSEKITPLKAVQDRADTAVVEQLRQNSPVGQIFLLTDQK